MAGIHSIKTAVVAPVFNEADTWRDIATELICLFDLVVVVDDGSTLPLEDPNLDGLVVLRHPRNLGKGVALETGFRHCLDEGADLIGTIDTDGEHDLRNFITALSAYRGEDMVNLSRGPHFQRYSWLRRARNTFYSNVVSRRIGRVVEDTQTGMRLFSARAIERCLKAGLPPGYAIETVMLKTVVAAGLQLTEMPMRYPGLVRNGKKYRNAGVIRSDMRAFLAEMNGPEPPATEKPAFQPPFTQIT